MKRGSSFRRGMALGLRGRFALRRIWARLKSLLSAIAPHSGSGISRREVIPRMTEREIKALTRELLRSLARDEHDNQRIHREHGEQR